MEVMNCLLKRLISAVLVMALVTPPVAMAEDQKQDTASAAQSSPAPPTSSSPPDAGAPSGTQESQPVQTSPDPLPD